MANPAPLLLYHFVTLSHGTMTNANSNLPPYPNHPPDHRDRGIIPLEVEGLVGGAFGGYLKIKMLFNNSAVRVTVFSSERARLKEETGFGEFLGYSSQMIEIPLSFPVLPGKQWTGGMGKCG